MSYEQPNEENSGSPLFTSEDMIHGYKVAHKMRKRMNNCNKENIAANVNTPCFTCEVDISGTTPLTSSTSGVTQKKGRKQRFHDQKCSLRMPMFDITNESNGAQKSSLKFNNNCNRKQICEESGCNLFQEQFANKDDDNSYLQDYEIDESVIHGACFSDDGLFDSDDSYGYVDSYSDEEDNFQQNLSSKIRSRAQHVIPEEYASLGSPSVECKHCHARMWKEERVNKNVTKGSPVFSVCCKKGDVKLPATPNPPTYLMDLYNDESADLNNLKDRDMISMKTYYSYRFQVRHNEVNCKVTDLRHLWDSHWKHMVDDILMKRRNVMRNSKLMLNDKQLQFYALAG
ncbi:hypothetical protein POM88_008731 [Heracleum sosnowskyi]|uniref:Uncharacterized protein n=1 Tax=Heracleum sosnowskyi TaxID=360622 RepID=A0AAD8N8V2_9APIA|nr:hypothetical protein POM88_008731 [Heracleum sosnowskyi]